MKPIKPRFCIPVTAMLFLFLFSPTVWSQSDPNQILGDFVGVWDADIELYVEGRTEPVKVTGVETNEMLGESWLISDLTITNDDAIQQVFRKWAIGFSPIDQAYVGFFAHIASPYHETQQGTFDPDTKTLTLLTQSREKETGNPVAGKRVIEFTNPDTRTLTLFQKLVADKEQKKVAKVVFTRVKE